MFTAVFSNSVLCLVVALMLWNNRNWLFRSLLILVFCSSVDSILRNSIFAGNDFVQPFLHRVNVWFNIGIGYFTFLLLQDTYQQNFQFLKRYRFVFIRYLTICYALILLFFLTQENFLISMISYGLPAVLMLAFGLAARPTRWLPALGAATIIGFSAYLSLAPNAGMGIMRSSDIYHYGLSVGLFIFHRAFNKGEMAAPAKE